MRAPLAAAGLAAILAACGSGSTGGGGSVTAQVEFQGRIVAFEERCVMPERESRLGFYATGGDRFLGFDVIWEPDAARVIGTFEVVVAGEAPEDSPIIEATGGFSCWSG